MLPFLAIHSQHHLPLTPSLSSQRASPPLLILSPPSSLSISPNLTFLQSSLEPVFLSYRLLEADQKMAMADNHLRMMAEAFKDLSNSLNTQNTLDEPNLRVAPFTEACSLVSPLFRCLGIAFKFAEMDYVAKVDDLAEASKSVENLHVMIQRDIEANCVRKAGSHTRNLLRVKRGLDMVKVLFENIVASDGYSLKDPASTAYAQVFAPYHGWVIRKAVAAGMYALPTRAQLLKKLKEDEISAKTEMQNYIDSSAHVIMYIDKLFTSRDLGIDW